MKSEHRLDHAPDTGVLRPGADLHLSQTFFGDIPLDETPDPSMLGGRVKQVYGPRRPQESPLRQCLCAHFYDFIQAYPEKYEKKHGFLKPVVEEEVNTDPDLAT